MWLSIAESVDYLPSEQPLPQLHCTCGLFSFLTTQFQPPGTHYVLSCLWLRAQLSITSAETRSGSSATHSHSSLQ